MNLLDVDKIASNNTAYSIFYKKEPVPSVEAGVAIKKKCYLYIRKKKAIYL
jgi:hypothetical protein